MEQTVQLNEGYSATVWWDVIQDKWAVVAVTLRHHKVVLGVLERSHRGEFLSPNYRDWYHSDEEQREAAEYYKAKYPDLANEDEQLLFEEGFAREEEALDDLLERAEEVADTLNQTDKGPFLVVDKDGRIVEYGRDIHELVEDLDILNKMDWVSPDWADKRTLMIAPASKFRVVS